MLTTSAVRQLLETTDAKVLSIYLNTNAAEGTWKEQRYRLKLLLDGIEEGLAGKEDRVRFSEDRETAERLLEGYKPQGKALVLFTSSAQKLAWSYTMSVALAEGVWYKTGPHLGPLVAALEEHPLQCATLVDREKARVFLVRGGEIEEQRSIRGIPAKRNKQNGGLPPVQAEDEERLNAHIRKVAANLEGVERETQFTRLILCGAKEPMALLERALSPSLKRLMAGKFVAAMSSREAQILRETQQLGKDTEREEESSKVEAVLTSWAKGGNAVAGTDQTLLALRHGDAHEMFIAGDWAQSGCECPTCKDMATSFVKLCPLCGSLTEPMQDIVERAVERA